MLALLASLLFASGSSAEPLLLEVSSVRARHDSRTGQPVLNIAVAGASKQALLEFTSHNTGNTASVRVNGSIAVVTVIREPVLGGTLQISDNTWSEQKVKSLVDEFSQTGAKVELDIVSKQ